MENTEGKRANKLDRFINFDLSSRVSSAEISNFTKHLSVMVKSGITLFEAIETLASKTKKGRFKVILESVVTDLEDGSSLTAALEKFPKDFDKFYISIIRIGEESGSLENNLDYLSDKLHRQAALRRRVKEALFYPTIVVVAALVVGSGISIFVLPKMADLFRSFDVALPLATRILLLVADFMTNYKYHVLVGLVILVFLFRLLLLTKFKDIWQKSLLSVPVLENFLISAETASLCRNIGIMLKSGLPITRTLEIAQTTTGNAEFKQYIKTMSEGVSQGTSLGDILYSQKCPKIPAMASKMISVGEKSGKLNDMLLYLGDYFEEETNNLAKSFSTVLEPVLLLFIGLIVVVLALAIITPIYQLTGSINS